MKKLLFLLTLSVCSGAAMAEDCEINLIDRNYNRVVLRFQSRDPWRGCRAILQQCIDTGYYNRMNFECIRVPFVEPGRMPQDNYGGYSGGYQPGYSTTTTTTTTITYEYEYEEQPRTRPSRPSTSRPSTSRPSTNRPSTARPSTPAPRPTTPAPTPSRPTSNTGLPSSGSANGRIPGPRLEVNNSLMLGADNVTYSRTVPRIEVDLESLMEDTTESKRPVSVGETVYYKGKLMIISSESNGSLELREDEGRSKDTVKAKREEVSLTRGCSGAICVFDSVIDLVNKKYVSVAGISYSSYFITKNTDDKRTLTYEVPRTNLALTKGCIQSRRGQVCVGNKGIAANNVYYQVVGIQGMKRIVVETLDSSRTLFQDVDPNSLVITQ